MPKYSKYPISKEFTKDDFLTGRLPNGEVRHFTSKAMLDWLKARMPGTILTADQIDAILNSTNPSATNPFATIEDINVEENITFEDTPVFDPDREGGYSAGELVSYRNLSSTDPQFQEWAIYIADVDIPIGVSPEDDQSVWIWQGQSTIVATGNTSNTIVQNLTQLRGLTGYSATDSLLVKDERAWYKFYPSDNSGERPSDGGDGSWKVLVTLEDLLAAAITNATEQSDFLSTAVFGVYDSENLDFRKVTWSTLEAALSITESQISDLDKYSQGYIDNIFESQSDPTGFIYHNEVQVSYDQVTRTVTLTANSGYTLDALLKSKPVSIFEGATTWTSPAHADTPGKYYLKINKDTGDAQFTNEYFNFDSIHIAYIEYNVTGSFKWAIRESHGCNMDYATHEHLHTLQGTALLNGGDLSDYTLLSTTLADRRPFVSETLVLDEDLKTNIPSLAINNYTHRFLEGPSNQKNFTVDNADIVRLDGTAPQINVFDGTNWVWQTLVTNNTFIKLFLIAIPTASDTESQKFRYCWGQAQQTSTNIDIIRGITTSDYVLGDPSSLASEFVFIGEVIIRYVTAGSGNWYIQEVNKLAGTRRTQVSSPSGNFLTTVASDDTLNGSGTTADPLIVDGGYVINSATAKTTPVDADEFGIWDSVSSALRKVTWANIKATLKTYFDSIYATISEAGLWEPELVAAATTEHPRWDDSSNANIYGRDTFGFGALPGGYRLETGGYFNLGSWTFIGTSDLVPNNPIYQRVRYLRNSFSYISKPDNISVKTGVSIRLVRPYAPADGTKTDGRILSAAFTDFDGNTYDGVIIGDQVWSTTNLKTTSYADGTPIPTGLNDTDWSNATSGAYAVYPFASVTGIDSEAEMIAAYGLLYNWPAVNNASPLIDLAQGHVPTDAEFTQLTNYIIANYSDIDSTNVGDALKSIRQVNSPFEAESDELVTIKDNQLTAQKRYARTDNLVVRIQTKTAAFNLAPGDEETYIRYTGATDINVSVPNTLKIGQPITIFQAGAGTVTLIAGTGVTALNGDPKTPGQNKGIQTMKVADGIIDNLGGVS